MDDLDAEIDRLEGSPEAKRRMKIVIRSILGKLLDKEACHALGVSQVELEQLRRDAVGGLLGAMVAERDPSRN